MAPMGKRSGETWSGARSVM
uniref:Uncharacterized protein n=1 Tax=Arundo donax TaxID=35708 RepID=A0A0A9GII6_ARUDO